MKESIDHSQRLVKVLIGVAKLFALVKQKKNRPHVHLPHAKSEQSTRSNTHTYPEPLGVVTTTGGGTGAVRSTSVAVLARDAATAANADCCRKM